MARTLRKEQNAENDQTDADTDADADESKTERKPILRSATKSIKVNFV